MTTYKWLENFYMSNTGPVFTIFLSSLGILLVQFWATVSTRM